MTLENHDLPGLFHGADTASLQAQRRFVRSTAARLILVVVAAVAAAFSFALTIGEFEVLSAIAAAAFLAALVIEVRLLDEQPHRVWYNGRALAESAKTLAWRYAVGASPFPVDEPQSSAYLTDQLAHLLDDIPESGIAATTETAVTQKMKALRGSDFTVRKEAYLTGRVQDQLQWYAAKAAHNRGRARLWKFGLVTSELLGAVLATLKAASIVDIDFTSIISTAIGAGAGWLAVKQHESLARAYTVASHELALVRARLEGVVDERTWAAEVADAEEAISREHTMWRAARSVREVPSANRRLRP